MKSSVSAFRVDDWGTVGIRVIGFRCSDGETTSRTSYFRQMMRMIVLLRAVHFSLN